MDQREQGRFAWACRVTLREEAMPKKTLDQLQEVLGPRPVGFRRRHGISAGQSRGRAAWPWATQKPAVEVSEEFLPGVTREAHRKRPIVDRTEKCLDVFAHDLVERRGAPRAGFAPSGRWRR